MGLDITAYGKIKPVPHEFNCDGEAIDPVTKEHLWDSARVYINPDFPEQADELVNGSIWDSEVSDGMRAGSYGGYNHWREELAKLAGYPNIPMERYGSVVASHANACWSGHQGPFYELINFSDCEGVIGPVTSAKLLEDFRQYAPYAEKHSDANFREKYTQWTRMFEIASGNGFVNFS